MSLLKWMGVGQPADPAPAAVALPGDKTSADPSSKMFGMENFGNTCYANSILQALYFCQPFRDLVCMTADGRPLPEIDLASLVEQVALPPPPPKEPASGMSTPKPAAPVMSGPKLSFKRQNSTTPSGGAVTPEPGAPGTSPAGQGMTGPALALESAYSAGTGAAAPATRTIESLPHLPPSIFSALRGLFLHISLNVADKGLVSPSAFVATLKKENPDFRTSQHQDAHEFLNYLLNRVAEDIDENQTRWEQQAGKEKENARLQLEAAAAAEVQDAEGAKKPANGHGLANGHAQSGTDGSVAHTHVSADSSIPSTASLTPASSLPTTPPAPAPRPLPSNRPTLVQTLFEGELTNETRCLNCQTVSHRDEKFLDLSIDIEPNSSVTACLREFSKGEMLLEDNRFKCDHCNQYCDAEKRMKVKSLPNILALHLKRFKYIEDANRNIRPTKLTYRVAFPLELRLFDTSDDAQNPDRLYELFAIVVHIGAGLAHGHYVTVVRTQGKWVLFDDDTVDVIKESDITKYFGDAPGGQGYVLFYQAVDVDLAALGLPDPQKHEARKTTIPPPAFPPEFTSDKQFAEAGIVYTAYAGTSQAAAAASLTPLPPATPAPAAATPGQAGKKGLKLDIPATPKFDPSATLNSLRGLAGPLTMPTPGVGGMRDQNGGFFSRTLRHSQSKLERQSAGMMTSPITAVAPQAANSLPLVAPAVATPGANLKARPSSSRGKEAAAWLAGKIGKEKKREGDETATTTNTNTTPAPTPLLRSETPPPVPPLPPLPLSMSPINGPESPLFGLGIIDQRRPSIPSSLERVHESAPRTPPPQEEGVLVVPRFFAQPMSQTPGLLSPPMSPTPMSGVSPPMSPMTPSSRTSFSQQAAAIPESPTQESAPAGRSHSVGPRARVNMHRSRPSTANAKLSSLPPTIRPSEETNGIEKSRGRRLSRGDSNDKTEKGEKKWYQRIGKNKERPATSGGKSEEDDEYALVSDVVDIAHSPQVDAGFDPPLGRTQYVPAVTGPIPAYTAPIERTDPFASIEDSSTASSTSERGDQTGPLPLAPIMATSVSLPASALPTIKSATSPNRAATAEAPKAKRKLSMNKASLRLSWFGSSNNLRDAAGGPEPSANANANTNNNNNTNHAGVSNVPPTPTEKKSRMPSAR